MIDDHSLDFRPGEETTELPAQVDAGVFFIGTIHTPWPTRSACPRRGEPDGPLCTIALNERWLPALDGLEAGATLDVIYWMHLARRDLVRQSPRSADRSFGTFALRSPMRPNPIALSSVKLIDRKAATLTVRGLDCVDGTPLVDLKPSRCPMWPPA